MAEVGFRIFKRVNRPDPELIAKFAKIPVANIGDEMSRIACMAARIRPYNSAPLAGPAFTVNARAGDNLMLHRAIDMAEPGDVIVVDGKGDLANALIGENMAMWAENRGVGGFVIDGAVRDVESLATLKIPVYAAGAQPNGPYKYGPGEINVPITCGTLLVRPGDIVIGDGDGVVVINPSDAEAVLERAESKLADEIATREAIVAGRWNREGFSEAALAAMGCEIVDGHCP